MDDPEARDPNRTIQVDALSDVELLDSSEGDAGAVSDAAPRPSALPPPLPYRRPSVIAIVVVVVLAGVLGAVGAYLIPSAEPAAPAPPPVAVSPPAEPTSAAEPAADEAVRHVPLGEGFIFRFDDDAGLPPSE